MVSPITNLYPLLVCWEILVTFISPLSFQLLLFPNIIQRAIPIALYKILRNIHLLQYSIFFIACWKNIASFFYAEKQCHFSTRAASAIPIFIHVYFDPLTGCLFTLQGGWRGASQDLMPPSQILPPLARVQTSLVRCKRNNGRGLRTQCVGGRKCKFSRMGEIAIGKTWAQDLFISQAQREIINRLAQEQKRCSAFGDSEGSGGGHSC